MTTEEEEYMTLTALGAARAALAALRSANPPQVASANYAEAQRSAARAVIELEDMVEEVGA